MDEVLRCDDAAAEAWIRALGGSAAFDGSAALDGSAVVDASRQPDGDIPVGDAPADNLLSPQRLRSIVDGVRRFAASLPGPPPPPPRGASPVPVKASPKRASTASDIGAEVVAEIDYEAAFPVLSAKPAREAKKRIGVTLISKPARKSDDQAADDGRVADRIRPGAVDCRSNRAAPPPSQAPLGPGAPPGLGAPPPSVPEHPSTPRMHAAASDRAARKVSDLDLASDAPSDEPFAAPSEAPSEAPDAVVAAGSLRAGGARWFTDARPERVELLARVFGSAVRRGYGPIDDAIDVAARCLAELRGGAGAPAALCGLFGVVVLRHLDAALCASGCDVRDVHRRAAACVDRATRTDATSTATASEAAAASAAARTHLARRLLREATERLLSSGHGDSPPKRADEAPTSPADVVGALRDAPRSRRRTEPAPPRGGASKVSTGSDAAKPAQRRRSPAATVGVDRRLLRQPAVLPDGDCGAPSYALGAPGDAASKRTAYASAEQRALYDNREKSRDAFLSLLRDFEVARDDVDARRLRALLPPSDDAFFFRGAATAAGAAPAAGAGHDARGPRDAEAWKTLRCRAAGVVRGVDARNVAWFAQLFEASLSQRAAAGSNKAAPVFAAGGQGADAAKLAKLASRLDKLASRLDDDQLAREAQSGAADASPAGRLRNGADEFFYLFARGADSLAFGAELLAALAVALDAEARSLSAELQHDALHAGAEWAGGTRPSTARVVAALRRLRARARLVGLVSCLPRYARAPGAAHDDDAVADALVSPLPLPLCPAARLGRHLGTAAALDAAIVVDLVAIVEICSALKWDRLGRRSAYFRRVFESLQDARRRCCAEQTSDVAALARLQIEGLLNRLGIKPDCRRSPPACTAPMGAPGGAHAVLRDAAVVDACLDSARDVRQAIHLMLAASNALRSTASAASDASSSSAGLLLTPTKPARSASVSSAPSSVKKQLRPELISVADDDAPLPRKMSFGARHRTDSVAGDADDDVRLRSVDPRTGAAVAAARLAPLAAHFFRRHPQLRAAAELALDAAAAAAADALADERDRRAAGGGAAADRVALAAVALQCAVDRVPRVLELVAPPRAPPQLARVAAELALTHFAAVIVPRLVNDPMRCLAERAVAAPSPAAKSDAAKKTIVPQSAPRACAPAEQHGAQVAYDAALGCLHRPVTPPYDVGRQGDA